MKIIASLFLIMVLIAGGPISLWAHGGGHDAEPKKEEAQLPELPEETFGIESIGEEEAGSGAVDYGMDGSIESLEMEEVGGDPLWGEHQEILPADETPLDLNKMTEHEDHDMPKMKHVEPSEHEWVSTSQKGYGWAAALTLLSGALFGFLTLKRPCE